MIYLDCSLIYRVPSDNTGIQRVTRSITREATACRYDICPAALHDDGVFYKLTDIPMPSDVPFSYKGEPIHFKSGDIYFALDSAWVYKIPERLSHLKMYGVTTGAMYYDLIPITHTEFTGFDKNNNAFALWVTETAKYSDFFACISDATKESLKREAAKLYPSRKINYDIAFSFHLGADISTYDSAYTPSNDSLLSAFDSNDTYLTVSTLEPRKNHALLLDAFDTLWKDFPKIKLCFIGKEGWMIEDIVNRVRSHPELNNNLFWLEGLKDKDVQWAYRKAKCVLFPSFEEGFGLPVIEALSCDTPVIASDIPIFHEVAGDKIGYLNPHDPVTLVQWVKRIEQNGIPKEIMPDGSFKWSTWRESAEELLEKISSADILARKNLAPILKKHAFENRETVKAPIPLGTTNSMVYLDCSWIYRSPSSNTGIQRVVRSIARESMPLNDVCPAVLHDDGIFYKLTDVPITTDTPFSHRGEPIHFKSGDIYFVLDSAWESKIPEKLSRLKMYGVTIGVMYYDLIPITHPNVCGINTNVYFEWVIETLKYTDFFACISDATKESLKREAAKIYPSREINDHIAFSFHLGADISTYDAGYTPSIDNLLSAFDGNDTYLTVSTIEPRKNQAMLLDAFDMAWGNFPKIKLCFIGKEGWDMETVKRIRSHPKLNNSLFWFEGLNDKDVQWAYRKAKCVLFPSLEEGFGLPIIEALHCGTPVIASDISVFHEVAGERIGYLDPHDPISLVKWIELIEQNGFPKEIMPDGSFKWATWRDSAEELLGKIASANSSAKKNLAPILKKHSFEQRAAIEIDRIKNKLLLQDAETKTAPEKRSEQKIHLIRQNSKLQEHEDSLLAQNSKLQKNEAQLFEQNAKLQEQGVFLAEHNAKFQEHETCLFDHSLKLKEHDTRLTDHILKLQEQDNCLIERNSKLQEQGVFLAEHNAKFQEHETYLFDHSLKLKEHDTRSTDHILKLQGQENCLLERNSKLQEQGAFLAEHNAKFQEHETYLYSHSLKQQEQSTLLTDQSSKMQEQEAKLSEQNLKIQEHAVRLVEQNVKIQDQEIYMLDRIQKLETAIRQPSLPFSNYSEVPLYLKNAEKHIGKKAPTDLLEKKENFYTYFNEIWGDDNGEVLRQHYESYLPYLPRNNNRQFLDIGCGAGEFLCYMQGHGISTLGIDIQATEVSRCLKRGLIVEQADALDFLKKYDGFFSGISLLQVIEHIPQDQHIELLSLAKEKLSDDGVLIIETINPVHPLAFNVFFIDQTHLRPLSVEYIVFMAQWCGFTSIDTLHLYPVPILPSSITNPTLHYHNYAIVARKRRNL